MPIRVLFGTAVKPGCEVLFEQVMASVVEQMKKGEPDLLDVAWGRTDLSRQYAMTMRYKNQAAYEFHAKSPWDVEARSKILGLIETHTSCMFTFIER